MTAPEISQHSFYFIFGRGEVDVVAKFHERRRVDNPRLGWIEFPGMQVKAVSIFLIKYSFYSVSEQYIWKKPKIASATKRNHYGFAFALAILVIESAIPVKAGLKGCTWMPDRACPCLN